MTDRRTVSPKRSVFGHDVAGADSGVKGPEREGSGRVPRPYHTEGESALFPGLGSSWDATSATTWYQRS